jgi:hypothetical protein
MILAYHIIQHQNRHKSSAKMNISQIFIHNRAKSIFYKDLRDPIPLADVISSKAGMLNGLRVSFCPAMDFYSYVC